MRRIVISALLAAQLMTTVVYATEETADDAIEAIEEEDDIEEVEVSPYYIIVKGLFTTGDDIVKEEAVFDGDSGFGIGIDLGYRVDEHWALEFDYSYDSNTVTRTKEGEAPQEYDADYTTIALDLVYTFEAAEHVGLFGKIGFEWEWGSIEDEDEYDYGVVFGAGLEYAFDETYRGVVEYEHSTVDSTRGDSIFAGIMINF